MPQKKPTILVSQKTKPTILVARRSAIAPQLPYPNPANPLNMKKLATNSYSKALNS